jgi:hypothetical protein
MTAWLAALIPAAALLGGISGTVWRGGRRDGKIDAVLEQLTDIAKDHEARLRAIEHR